MSDIKKFLDYEGVQHLWSKINMNDYPNNETLINVINAIDETKADRSELVQSDWSQTDETALDFIKNKPDIPEIPVTSVNGMTGDIIIENNKQLTAMSSLITQELSDTLAIADLAGVITEQYQHINIYNDTKYHMINIRYSRNPIGVFDYEGYISIHVKSYTDSNNIMFILSTDYTHYDITITNGNFNKTAYSYANDKEVLLKGNNAEYIPTTDYSPATKKYVDDSTVDKISTPSIASVGQTIVVKSVDENGKPTEYEAVDIATLSDKYEWHEIQLYRNVAYIANDPDYAASITDWDGLVQIPDPEYPDDEKAISTIISIIGDIFNQGPTYMNSYAITSCNSIATSYLAIYNAGIFTTSVHFAIKNIYDNSVTEYSLAYRDDKNVLTIMQYPAYRDMNQVIYDIGAKQIISEFIDHNFYYTKKYVDATKIPIPEAASVGQTIVVKAVDDNGKPVEWEAVDPWVITSSTEGSTKKFKLTIDDDGVLTATEIVDSEA